MNKPSIKTIRYYDFNDCMQYLETKYNFDHRDISNASVHRRQEVYEKETGDIRPAYVTGTMKNKRSLSYSISYLKEKGLLNDIQTLKINEKEITVEEALEQENKYHKWSERFLEWSKERPVPEHQDFWIHVIDRFDVSNGGFVYIDGTETNAWIPDWALKIYKMIFDEFSNGLNEVNLRCSW